MIDFIGIGAQKAGTSWVYACLYEHPDICAPVKEIHFFSRPRFSNGKEWYESHFNRCDERCKKGEFSTSYLYSQEAPARIARMYPEVKLIAILRNPINRAYSHYCNALKAGQIKKDVSFKSFEALDASVLEQGKYAEQLERYSSYFSRKQLMVLLYEDIEKDPAAFIKKIYEHIGVDSEFVPTMLHEKVNSARVPKSIYIERTMHRFAEFLRKIHLDRLVWAIRLSKAPNYIRMFNTAHVVDSSERQDKEYDRKALIRYFSRDVDRLASILARNIRQEWGFNEDH